MSHSATEKEEPIMRNSAGPTRIATFCCCVALGCSSAQAASYVGADLYALQMPAGLPIFSALDAFGGQVGGRAAPSADNFHAILWSAPAGTASDLTPAIAATANIQGVYTGQQVGAVN